MEEASGLRRPLAGLGGEGRERPRAGQASPPDRCQPRPAVQTRHTPPSPPPVRPGVSARLRAASRTVTPGRLPGARGRPHHPSVGRRAPRPALLTRVPRPSERRGRPAAARAARVPSAGAGPARAVGPRGDARSGPCREQEGGGRRGTASGAAGGRRPRVGAGESRFSPRDTSGRRPGRGTPTYPGRCRLRTTAPPQDNKRRGAYL